MSPPRRRPWTQGPRRRTSHSWNGCGLCLEVQCDPSRARSREAEAASARRRLRGAQIAAVRTCILRLLFFSTCGARTRGDREHNRLQGSEPPSDWPRERGSCAARRGAGLSRLYLAANRNPRNPELPALYRSQPAPIARGAITIASASGPKAPPAFAISAMRSDPMPLISYAPTAVSKQHRAPRRAHPPPRASNGAADSTRGAQSTSAPAPRERVINPREPTLPTCAVARVTRLMVPPPAATPTLRKMVVLIVPRLGHPGIIHRDRRSGRDGRGCAGWRRVAMVSPSASQGSAAAQQVQQRRPAGTRARRLSLHEKQSDGPPPA